VLYASSDLFEAQTMTNKRSKSHEKVRSAEDVLSDALEEQLAEAPVDRLKKRLGAAKNLVKSRKPTERDC